MNKKNSPITYSSSGVDIEKGNQLVEEIKPIIRETKVPGADIEIGGFGGLFDIMKLGFNDPLLVSSTDGVGTKLLLAIESNNVSGVGIDLVAMCVNDLIVQGAQPLFFLDYFATGILSKKTAKEVIKSIADGCIQSKCALIGGETAEMPDMYKNDDYDLAGFCVGIVDQENVITGEDIQIGDTLIGIASSGPHSNGYSLIRKVLEIQNIDDKKNSSVIRDLLAPTKIYVKSVSELMKKIKIKGMAHITGGGITENIPRILNPNLMANINTNTWEMNPIFEWIATHGNISEEEMRKTFNCGIGMVLVIESKDTRETLEILSANGEKAWEIGSIIEGSGGVNYV